MLVGGGFHYLFSIHHERASKAGRKRTYGPSPVALRGVVSLVLADRRSPLYVLGEG